MKTKPKRTVAKPKVVRRAVKRPVKKPAPKPAPSFETSVNALVKEVERTQEIIRRKGKK